MEIRAWTANGARCVSNSTSPARRQQQPHTRRQAGDDAHLGLDRPDVGGGGGAPERPRSRRPRRRRGARPRRAGHEPRQPGARRATPRRRTRGDERQRCRSPPERATGASAIPAIVGHGGIGTARMVRASGRERLTAQRPLGAASDGARGYRGPTPGETPEGVTEVRQRTSVAACSRRGERLPGEFRCSSPAATGAPGSSSCCPVRSRSDGPARRAPPPSRRPSSSSASSAQPVEATRQNAPARSSATAKSPENAPAQHGVREGDAPRPTRAARRRRRPPRAPAHGGARRRSRARRRRDPAADPGPQRVEPPQRAGQGVGRAIGPQHGDLVDAVLLGEATSRAVTASSPSAPVPQERLGRGVCGLDRAARDRGRRRGSSWPPGRGTWGGAGAAAGLVRGHALHRRTPSVDRPPPRVPRARAAGGAPGCGRRPAGSGRRQTVAGTDERDERFWAGMTVAA